MKVAYLTGEYPRATDTFIQREILAVEQCGVEVERFAVRRPGDEHMVGDRQRSERDLTTYLLERPKESFAGVLARAFRRSPIRFVKAAKLAVATRRLGPKGSAKQAAYFVEAAVLSELMAERGVDHLHNHFADSSCTVAMLASALGGTTYSFTLHGPAIFFEPNEWHLGTKLETAAFCATISNFARSQACLFSPSDVWPRIRIVHCGVEDPAARESGPLGVEDPAARESGPLGVEDPAARESGLGVGEVERPPVERTAGPCELLFVGRLDAVKGVVVLFDAVASLLAAGTDLRLTLVGDGPQRTELERRATALGIAGSVTFAGYRNSDEVQQHLRDTDVFVLPSFAEGVPVSLMEAMAMSLPVVATNVGGVTELVRDGQNGFVVAPGDAVALEAAIADLAADDDLRRRLGAVGRSTVRADFDSSTEARRLVTLFRDPSSPSPDSVRPVPVPVGG